MNYVEIGNRHVVVALLTNKTFLEESIYYPVYVMLTIFEGIVMGCILFLCPIYVKTLAGTADDRYVLIFATYLRMFSPMWDVFFLVGVLVERLAATLKIGFYETVNLSRVSTCIIVWHFVMIFLVLTLITECTAQDRWILFLATHLRMFSLLWDVFFIAGVLVERLAATLKIGFYETVNYTRVSTVIIFSQAALIIIVLTLVMEFMYDWYWAVVLGMIGGILGLVAISATLFKTLYSWNLRQLQQMREFGMKNVKAANDRYLSRRFQLEENVNALELVKTITIYYAFVTVVCTFFIGLQFILANPNTNFSQFMLILFDVSTALAGFFYFALLFYKVEPWRRGFYENLRKIFGTSLIPDFARKARIDPLDSIDESAHYFSYYHNAWN
ncbi:unnamed protein product, partial [Mesorhabditis spiculigera]